MSADDAEDKAPETGFQRDSQVRSRTGLGLRIGNRIVPLSSDEIVMGRAADCDVVLDGALVSRRHAKVTIGPDSSIKIEDLGSRNGLQVDGQTIKGPTLLRRGSKITVGEEKMEVVELDAEMKRRITATDFRSAHTVRFERPATLPDPIGPARSQADANESTLRAQSFDLLSGVVDKALQMGRSAEAERLLGTILADALKDAQKKGKLAEGMAEKAAGCAVKLALASAKPAWIDYVFRLYKALGVPVPLELVDEMYTVLRKVRGINRSLLDEYVALLKTKNLGPAGRFAIQRIEGLSRLAAL